MKTIKLGITGGIASGKSVVCDILRVMGFPIYCSDDRAKELMKTDATIRYDLISLLGKNVYNTDGKLNRKMLADYIFAHKDQANQVNAIVHPRVKDDFFKWALQYRELPIVGIESAILIEAGFLDAVDQSLLVYAPKELRIKRAMQRDNFSQELVEHRINAQISDSKKLDLVDFLINNDDKTLLLPQVENLVQELTLLSEES